LQDPHLRERGVFQQVPDPAGGFEGVNPPWKMTGSASHLRGAPPGVGEHAAAVLRDWLAAGGER
jgi:crotonobetainyl-CoA:carnitine CoA-transferase CaiB-like acyl-CoA transferase